MKTIREYAINVYCKELQETTDYDREEVMRDVREAFNLTADELEPAKQIIAGYRWE